MAAGSVSMRADEIGDSEDTAGPGPVGPGGAATGNPGCPCNAPDVTPPAGSSTSNQPRFVIPPGTSTNNEPRPEDFMRS